MQRCLVEKSLFFSHRGFEILYSACYQLNRKSNFTSAATLGSEPDYDAARKWHASFSERPIPRIGEVTYSRSSGPGGQNVNKVNSKAQLRVPFDQLLPLLPEILHAGIQASRYSTEKTHGLLIQSDESRKQAANKDTCYRRLNELILDVYQRAVPGETSEEQKEKVKMLKKSENESRLRLKKHISSKKAARRGED